MLKSQQAIYILVSNYVTIAWTDVLWQLQPNHTLIVIYTSKLKRKLIWIPVAFTRIKLFMLIHTFSPSPSIHPHLNSTKHVFCAYHRQKHDLYAASCIIIVMMLTHWFPSDPFDKQISIIGDYNALFSTITYYDPFKKTASNPLSWKSTTCVIMARSY